jgi:hypothetical protein
MILKLVACSINRGEEECIQDIGGKARKKEPLGRPRYRWKDNINMNLIDIRCGGMDWIDLVRDRTSGGLL